jgi:hypothetical protein
MVTLIQAHWHAKWLAPILTKNIPSYQNITQFSIRTGVHYVRIDKRLKPLEDAEKAPPKQIAVISASDGYDKQTQLTQPLSKISQ